LRGLKLHVDEPGRAARFKPYVSRLSAIVTVTDEGGSSGKLRREFGILPPGDIRNCLVALAEDEQLFTRLFNYRFSGRSLAGHSFGNLFLAALTGLTHDFAKAVQVSSEVLAVRGEIFPSTLSDVRLKARLRDGRMLSGESRINKTRVPIQRLLIVPGNCRPLPEALAAIKAADLITVGPGSLYTSLIPNLLVRGLSEEVRRSKAVKIYIANLMTQPGETRGYTAADHLRALHEHAGARIFDRVILNTRLLSPGVLRRYATQRAGPLQNDLQAIRALGVEPFMADLLEEDHVARHDSRKLARLLLSRATRRPQVAALGPGR
jgi:uncharacterized cofD-like protein